MIEKTSASKISTMVAPLFFVSCFGFLGNVQFWEQLCWFPLLVFVLVVIYHPKEMGLGRFFAQENGFSDGKPLKAVWSSI